MLQHAYQPSMSNRQAKQNSHLTGTIDGVSHFLSRELRQQEGRVSSQENERREIKPTVPQPVLNPKHSSSSLPTAATQDSGLPRQHAYQLSMSDNRQAKQNNQPTGTIDGISHFLSRDLRRQESKLSTQENKQEIKPPILQPVLNPKRSSIQSAFVHPKKLQENPLQEIKRNQETAHQASEHHKVEPRSIEHQQVEHQQVQKADPREGHNNNNIPSQYPTNTKHRDYPMEIKSEKGRIESQDVKRQDVVPTMSSPGRRAPDPDPSVPQPPPKLSEARTLQGPTNTPSNKVNSPKPAAKTKKKSTNSNLAFSNNPFTFLKGALAKEVKTEELSQDDVIIAVMGPTGSGKSTFIKTITGFDTGVGHGLESCTSEINIVKLSIPELAEGDIFFVDTPGFDDTHKSDADILKMVADWLKTTYEKEILLSGLLYFHRISDNRMAGTPLKNLRMFEELCGKNACQNIILTTTMWDEVDEETGASREEELKLSYWRSMLERGSTTNRFMGTRESGLRLIDPLIDAANARSSLLLQQEMVDMSTKLPATSAGIRLFSEMEDLVKRRQEVLRQIRNAMKHTNGEKTSLAGLQGEHQRLKVQLDTTLNEMRKLKLPLGKRLSRMTRKWFSFKFMSL